MQPGTKLNEILRKKLKFIKKKTKNPKIKLKNTTKLRNLFETTLFHIKKKS